MDFQITDMMPAKGMTDRGCEKLAHFNVEFGPLKIWRGGVSRNQNGEIYAALPGRRTAGFSITSPELRAAIKAAALAAYQELPNG